MGRDSSQATFRLRSFPHQSAFHKSDARIRALIAGTGGGKTWAGSNELIKQALLREDTHLAVAPTYQMSRDVVEPMVFDKLPREVIEDWNKMERRLVLKNGSIIQFLSADKPDRLRGRGPGSIWIDEAREIPKYAWDVLFTRGTRGKACKFWITTTPNSYDWVYHEVYKPWQQGNEDYYVIVYSSADNPFFDDAHIALAKERLSEEFFRQEYEASFELFTGRVYKAFSTQEHVVDKIEVKPDWVIISGIDFGYSNPFVHLWIALDGDDNAYIFDEYYQAEKTIEEHASEIKRRQEGLSIQSTYADPSGEQYIAELRKYGIHADKANNAVAEGINKVTELVQKKKIKIAKHCEKTIEEFEQYHWPDQKPEQERKETPVKQNDHCMDALRYALFTHFSKPKPGIFFGDL